MAHSSDDRPSIGSGNKDRLARLILDSAEDFAVFSTDLDGCITSWSPGAERLLGWTEAEALEQHSCMIFTPEDMAADACGEEFRTATEAGRAEDERWHLRKDGTRFWSSGLMMRFEDEEDRRIGFVKILRDTTAEHEAIEERLKLHRNSAEILESIADAFYAVDDQWRFTYVNRKAEKWWQRDRQELIGKVYWEEFPEALGGIPYEAHLQAMQERTVQRVEALSPILGRWVEMDIHPTASGGVSVYFRDITERRRRQSALEESQARLRLALDAASMAIWEMDLRTEQLVPTPSLAAFLGMDIEELNDIEAVRARYHPDDRDRVRAEGQEALKRGDQKFETEFRFIRDEGDTRWFLLRADVFLSDAGEPEHVLGALVDITSRKAAEDALRQSEAKFQAIANSIDQMIWSTRADGYHDYFNDRWYEYTGVEPGRTDGDGWSDLFHLEDRERTWQVWEHSLATGDPYHIEYRLRHHSGSYRWVIGRAQPVRDEQGRITRWFGTCTDVHDLKTAEKELRDLNDTLEQRVEQRTAELEHAQEALRQSQKLEAMGTLTGGVAHDFNNLLTPIIGGLDMLQRRGVGDERAQRQIAGALQSAERAKTLVQRLLAFARRQPLQPAAIEVGPLLNGMVELIASTSGPRIKVQLEVEPDLPLARADANQLEMALLNLAVNSRDAMPDGGILNISAVLDEVKPGEMSQLSAGSYVRLAVADTGSGMDDETLKRAIEPFFSTKGVGRGTGLGLSMVHGLALQLGGSMAISSKPGVGTDVRLWLPVASGAAAAAAPHETHAETSGSGLVLLVDDEELVRSSTSDMLVEMGYSVEEVGSAEEALRKVRDGLRPKILITDHLMPGMTGTELARVIWERHPDMPVLLISGYAEDQGVDLDIPRLTKPFRRSDLSASLTDLA